jgi:hypothetical protein
VKRSPWGAFTFDTKRLDWTYLGEWLLPFKGQAYYDGELDAWVGLCLYKEGVGAPLLLPSTACRRVQDHAHLEAWTRCVF